MEELPEHRLHHSRLGRPHRRVQGPRGKRRERGEKPALFCARCQQISPHNKIAILSRSPDEMRWHGEKGTLPPNLSLMFSKTEGHIEVILVRR